MAASPELAALAALFLLLSASLTRAWIGLALKRRWLDLPDDRRLHAQPTPRGGGIGIFLPCLLVMAWLAQAGVGLQREWCLSALGLLLCAGAGLLDDLGRLGSLGKLALQAVSTLLLAWAWMPDAAPAAAMGWGPVWPVVGGMAFSLVLVNFSNFMDGSDGLLSLQAILVGIGLLWPGGLSASVALLALLFVAALLGFLPFNFPRARVFLGDVGSHAIGYVMAMLLLAGYAGSSLTPVQLLLLPSALLLDAGYTLAGRILRGQRFWQSHADHLYQWALRRGVSRPRLACAYAAWTLAALLLATRLAGVGSIGQWMALALVCLLALGLWWGLRWRWSRSLAGATA